MVSEVIYYPCSRNFTTSASLLEPRAVRLSVRIVYRQHFPTLRIASGKVLAFEKLADVPKSIPMTGLTADYRVSHNKAPGFAEGYLSEPA
jgi:hypothetical protein